MEEEEIKKRLLQQQMQQQMQQQQIEATLKTISMQILEPRARERLANLKVVKPDMAMQLEAYLAQLHHAGQLRGRISEEQLIAILKKLSSKRDIRIRRK
ncbi:MAG: hypothetical protein HYY37_00510 [Candidatus Aenigmarchaeota archaeon]|nr:hypothetical protein [Candidatus Aenigmarchaeota archaeon]